MTPLDKAWMLARESFAWADFDGLLKAGVPSDITGRLPSDGGLALGAIDIGVVNGRWERRFRGERAIVLPVWGHDPERTTIFQREAVANLQSLQRCQETVNKAVARDIGNWSEKQQANLDGMIAEAEQRLEFETAKAQTVVINLVAFRIATPRSFWLFDPDGYAPLLGEEALFEAEYFEKPLHLHESPLDWLRARCEGACIIDWRHYWPGIIGSLKALKIDDKAFAARARAIFQRPLPVPPILVPQ